MKIPAGKTHHFFYSLLAVHEAAWDGIGGEDLIALTELLEEDAVGEPLAADTDPLQHTVAAQLVQHKWGVDLASLQEHINTVMVYAAPYTCCTYSGIQHSSQYTPEYPDFKILIFLQKLTKNKTN